MSWPCYAPSPSSTNPPSMEKRSGSCASMPSDASTTRASSSHARGSTHDVHDVHDVSVQASANIPAGAEAGRGPVALPRALQHGAGTTGHLVALWAGQSVRTLSPQNQTHTTLLSLPRRTSSPHH